MQLLIFSKKNCYNWIFIPLVCEDINLLNENKNTEKNICTQEYRASITKFWLKKTNNVTHFNTDQKNVKTKKQQKFHLQYKNKI